VWIEDQRQVLQLRLEQLAQPLAAPPAAPADARPPERAANVDIRRFRRLPEHLGQAMPLPLLPTRHSVSNSCLQPAHLNSYIGTVVPFDS